MSLNLTPKQVGKFRYLGTLKAQLSPLQEHTCQLGAELQHSCWESLGTAQEGKGFFLIVRERLGTAGAL